MKRVLTYLDVIIYWAIVLIPFSIAIAPAIAHSFIGLMSVSFIIKKILKREKLFIHTPLNVPFLFLMIVSFLSFKNSIDYQDSFHGIGKLIINALVFLICAEEIKNELHVRRIILSIISGVTLVSTDALWQLSTGKDFIRGNDLKSAIGLIRATASFPNPNVFGVYLSAVTPLIVGLSLYYFKGKIKLLMLAISALATNGIVLTFSRGSALGLYIATLFVSIVRRNKTMLISLLIILIIFPIIAPHKIKIWAKSINYNPVVFMLNADRISIYRNTVNMIKHHPLVGVGVNTFSKNYLSYKLPEPPGAETPPHVYAHNNFLHMAGDIGLLGLFSFLWFLFRFFKDNLRTYRRFKDTFLKVTCISLCACIIAFLVNGMTETSLYYSRVSMIFWYLIGFSLSLRKFSETNNT